MTEPIQGHSRWKKYKIIRKFACNSNESYRNPIFVNESARQTKTVLSAVQNILSQGVAPAEPGQQQKRSF